MSPFFKLKLKTTRVDRYIWLLDYAAFHCFRYTSRVPVQGRSSVCLNCMKYRIIIVIIIIISMGQILLSYIANTSRMHACVHTCVHTHACTRMRAHASTHPHTQTLLSPPYRLSLFIGAQPSRPARWRQCRSLAIEINTGADGPVSQRFWVFLAYKTF